MAYIIYYSIGINKRRLKRFYSCCWTPIKGYVIIQELLNVFVQGSKRRHRVELEANHYVY